MVEREKLGVCKLLPVSKCMTVLTANPGPQTATGDRMGDNGDSDPGVWDSGY